VRCEVIYKVKVECVLLKMISTTVGENSRVKYVSFGYAPTIEPRFREQRLQKSIVANLDISRPETPSFDEGIRRKCPAIIMVQDPSRRSHVPIATWRVYRREFLKAVEARGRV